MTCRSADGAALLRTFTAAVSHFEGHVDEINALNVFPVPDGDTGSNMMATLRAALDEAAALPDRERDAGRVAAAISLGALMGARGNSGVILSQVFRGMSEAVKGRKRLNGLDLAHALAAGRETAYAAVAKPVEGTILTVIREASAAAVTSAERDPDIEGVLTATVAQAERAVARTPSMLPILREAGVVDSGGEGLYRLFQGALLHLVGGVAATATTAGGEPRRASLVAHADEGFGYETMFLLTAEHGTLDVDGIRTTLEQLGDSVLVAGDGRAVKVHVHNERPDAIIAFGLSQGTLSRISVENLDHQARDVREARAGAFTGQSAVIAPVEPVEPLGAALASAADGREALAAVAEAGGEGISVVAVAAGDGLERVINSVLPVGLRVGRLGVVSIVRGGQSANPSTGELLRAIREAPTRHVIVLPNNPNVKLAAQQAAALVPERRVAVVPTRNAAEGIAGLLAMDPTKGADENAAIMLQAARAIRSLQVTDAVRDARIGGRKVKKGQTIVLDPDDGLVASGNDRRATIIKGIAALEAGFELVSIYYGRDVDLAEAEGLASDVTAAFEGVEVELINGGQPHYHFLIAAE